MRKPKFFFFTEDYREKQLGILLRDGDKVVIDPTKTTRGNDKRNAWLDNLPEGKVFTITHDKKFPNSPAIFALKEDKSKPKWLFAREELVLVKRAWTSKLLDWSEEQMLKAASEGDSEKI